MPAQEFFFTFNTKIELTDKKFEELKDAFLCVEEDGEYFKPFGFKVLFDKWDYEGTGQESHYYTFTDENDSVKHYTKIVQDAVKKLQQMGVGAELKIGKYETKNHCEECGKELESGTVFCTADCRRHYYSE